MAKVSSKKIYNEIEFNERRLLLLLSNDLLWFKKNLVNIKSHKNRKAFYKKKTEKYNQIFKTTQELSSLADKISKTDSDILTSPYVYLEQEKLNAQNVKVKDSVKVKNLSKPKLFEVITFTNYVDLFNNPKSRKYPKSKCVQIVKKNILDKNNNMPSNKIAREYFINNESEATSVINNMYIESALYLKRDMELEMQAKNERKRKKQQELTEQSNRTFTRTTLNKKTATKESTAISKTTNEKPLTQNKKPEPKTTNKKLKYNTATKAYEYDYSENEELGK